MYRSLPDWRFASLLVRPVKPFEESLASVTSGVYWLSRHPMHLGFVIILISDPILMGSLMPYIVIPIFAVLMDRVFIQVEEKMLEARFGEA